LPTIQELISDIDARLPNKFTTAQKVEWFNDLQLEIDKDKTRDEIYEFFTVTDQPIYPLPTDCTIELLKFVGISQDLTISESTIFDQYTFKAMNDEFTGNNYYDATNGLIGLYPVPDTDSYSIRLIYVKKSQEFNAGDLTVMPDLKEKYHNIFKYDCMQIIASAKKDTEIANYYESKKLEMLAIMRKDRMEEKVKTPLKSKANRWW
jgi:hypothetical protein